MSYAQLYKSDTYYIMHNGSKNLMQPHKNCNRDKHNNGEKIMKHKHKRENSIGINSI